MSEITRIAMLNEPTPPDDARSLGNDTIRLPQPGDRNATARPVPYRGASGVLPGRDAATARHGAKLPRIRAKNRRDLFGCLHLPMAAGGNP
jgi:hypothetical protein